MADTLQSRLPHIAAELRSKISTPLKLGAEGVAVVARENVPVGPPDIHLKDKITVERTGPAEYSVVAGDKDAFYGHIVEHGSVKMAARPFLVPALESHADEILRGINEMLRRL